MHLAVAKYSINDESLFGIVIVKLAGPYITITTCFCKKNIQENNRDYYLQQK